MGAGLALTLIGVLFLAVGLALIANFRGLSDKVGRVAAVWGAIFGDRSGLRHQRRIAMFYGAIISVIGAALVAAGVARL